MLDTLAREHGIIETAYFTPGSETGGAPASVVAGSRVEQAVLADVARMPDAAAFVCGNPSFVKSLRRNRYLAGLALADIHSDAFVSSPPPAQATGT